MIDELMCVCVCSYLLLLSQYEAVSFCDAVFASYVLLPVQQRHSVVLRKTVWGEHVTLLHSLSLPPSQVLLVVAYYYYSVSYTHLTLPTIYSV